MCVQMRVGVKQKGKDYNVFFEVFRNKTKWIYSKKQKQKKLVLP